MNNREIVMALAKQMNWTTDEVSRALNSLSKELTRNLADGNTVAFQGFGQFEVSKKNERISANPLNGKRYLIPPKLVPVFKPGSTLKSGLKTDDHE